MMPDKDTIVAAQRKLDAAVDEFMAVMEWNAGVTTAWAMVAHQHEFSPEGDVMSAYQCIYKGGSLADHQALGLFDIAKDNVRGIGRWRDSEPR